MGKLRVLLAMHNPKYDELLTDVLEMEDYEVIKAGSVDEMLEKMGIPSNSPPNASPEKPFEWYIMDVNLGSPADDLYDSAVRIYQHIKSDVEAGKSKFMAISGNVTAVKNANAAGIPCMSKADTVRLTDLIEN